jgi:hypothetical protein
LVVGRAASDRAFPQDFPRRLVVRTIVVPALVAALVTLLLEFFAKPYLEVRKERLLRAARRRWELVEAIQAVEERAHLLGFMVGEGEADLLTVEKLIEDLARDIDRAEELSTGLEEQLPDPIVSEMYFATGFYWSTMDRLRACSRLPEEDRISAYRSELTGEGTFALPGVYLLTPKWRVFRRRKLVKRAGDAWEGRRRSKVAPGP